MRYHFFVTDRLGNVRVVATADGVIEQENGFSPYGESIGTDAQFISDNPYKWGGKEWDADQGAYDFGARMYAPADARWSTMDPLCEKYYHISPYAYCAGNPVNLVDPDGRDIYYMTEDGRMVLALKEEDENRDKLYCENSEEVLTVYNQSILSDLSQDRVEGFNYAISSSMEMINVFDYASRNSNVEWAIGSFMDSNNALSLAIIRGSDNEHVNRLSSIVGISEESLVSTIHTHIGYIQDHGASGFTTPTRPGNDRENIINLYYRLNAQGKSLPNHFVYETPNQFIYQYTPWKGDIPFGRYTKRNLAKALKVWNKGIKAF